MQFLQSVWLECAGILHRVAQVIIGNSDQMLVTAVLVIVLTGLVGGMIVRKLQQPRILGASLAGVVVGIFFKAGFGAAANNALESMANIGVALLLFAMGLEFSRKDLKPIQGIAVWGTLAQVVFTLVTATMIAWGVDRVTGWFPSWAARILFGSAFVSTSTAVVLKTLGGKGMASTLSARVMIGMSIVQDLTVVPMMLLATRLGNLSDGAWEAVRQLGIGAVGLVVILFVGRYLMPKLLKTAAMQGVRELYLLAVLTIALGVGYFAEWTQLSFSFGAFLVGIALSESVYGKRALYELVPVRDLFAMLFFVSIGMMLDVKYLADNIWLVCGLVAATSLSRTVFLSGITWLSGYRNVIPVAMLFGMVATSEMAFIVCRTALDGGLIGNEAYSLILCITVCSMIAGPAADGMTSPVYAFLRKTLWKNGDKRNIALPQPDLAGHVVIAAGGLIGRSIAQLMKHWNRPYILVEPEYQEFQKARQEELQVLYGDLRQEVILEAAGVARAQILLAASPVLEDNIAVIRAVRALRDNLEVVTRADTLKDVEKLRPYRLYEIVQPKFEAALEMARQALLSMKTPATSVQNSLDEIRFAHYRQTGGEISPSQLVDSLRSYIGLVELYWSVIPDYSPVAGKTLAESHLRKETGMSVVGVLRDGQFISNLQADFRLEAGDTVAAIGDSVARRKWENLLGTSAAETAAAAQQALVTEQE